MLFLMVVAELPRGFAGSHYVGSNHNGQAEGEPGRRCRSIQVEEMPEAVPVIVRAGRPRSQDAFDHTLRPGTWFTSCQGIGQEAWFSAQESLPP